MKICSKCKINQSLYRFHFDKNRKDGLSPWCNACTAYNSLNPAIKIKHFNHATLYGTGLGYCSDCKRVKSLSDFFRDKGRKWGYARCKPCMTFQTMLTRRKRKIFLSVN